MDPETTNSENDSAPSATPETRDGAAAAKRKRWHVWLREMLVVVLIFAAVKAWQKRDLLPEGVDAPSLTFFGTDGQPHRLSEYRGRAVQLHVWATWCHVCTKEFGELRAVHESTGDDTVLLAVAVHSGGPDVLAEYEEAEQLGYPIYVGGDEFVEALNVNRYPTNYYISPDGVIVDTTVGFSTRVAMRHRLRRAAR